MKLHKGQRGFTLIELLVVIGIIAVLAAVLVPAVTSFVGSGEQAAADAEVKAVELAVDLYMVEHSGTILLQPAGLTNGITNFTVAEGCVVDLYPDYLKQADAVYNSYSWTSEGVVTATPIP